jgi:hypothetical protein
MESTKKRIIVKIEAEVAIDAEDLAQMGGVSEEVKEAIDNLRGFGSAEITDIRIDFEKDSEG